jgi:predicted secreted hydrolase
VSKRLPFILAAPVLAAAPCFFTAGSPPAPEQGGGQAAAAAASDGSATAEGWREAGPGYSFSFPRDHGAHPDYKIEWWYYTGNVESGGGRRFGYQLTFFRVGVTPSPANPSRWAVRDLYMAHLAISDINGEAFHSFERLNRAGVGWAGAATDGYAVWNEDWQARLDGRDHLLSAGVDGFRLDLRLVPSKPEVIHGEGGVSQKGPSEGNASHYYSMTRLDTSGSITVGGEAFEVSGLSWMDHEFGTSFLEQGQVGWDWLSIQLSDGRDLMLFQLRREDGSIDPRSSGTLVDAEGKPTHIGHGEFSLVPGEVWRSGASGAAYPTLWQVEVPAFGLRLKVRAALKDQELRATESTAVTYWEGSIEVSPAAGGRGPGGRGYLEMTGYTGRSMGAILR